MVTVRVDELLELELPVLDVGKVLVLVEEPALVVFVNEYRVEELLEKLLDVKVKLDQELVVDDELDVEDEVLEMATGVMALVVVVKIVV